jgi:hypothetical protein
MKKLLIIYAHWHPSNLAGVHRPRLIGNYLAEYGWKPRVLTVEEQYFEENPDPDFEKTFSPDFEVTRVKAFPIIKPRLIGDIGLRAFFQLYKKAKEIIRTEKIDFIWVPIPSFYQAVLGRMLYEKTGIPYGIDYIDPWIRNISGRKKLRAVFSNWIARMLEPYAVKKVSLISGVSTSYYQPVLERNLKDKIIEHVGMPYGFDPNDHNITLKNLSYPWDEFPGCKPILYAGAFLPQSGLFMRLLFKTVSEFKSNGRWNSNIRFFFVGTGSYQHKSVKSYAKEAGIGDIVVEIRERKPFLHVLNYLDVTWRVMIIGSTEKHYTASKTFQALLSKRPVFTMFHEKSSAIDIIKEASADKFTFSYSEQMTEEDILDKLKPMLAEFIKEDIHWKPGFQKLDKYSARNSAKLLVEKLDKICPQSTQISTD